MTGVPAHDLFQLAAEAEDGMPVSAGARIAHVRSAIAAGRSYFVDLTDVPENKRPELVAEIRKLIDAAKVAQGVSKRSVPGS